MRKPVLITVVVVNSLWIWNEILIAMIFLQKNDTGNLGEFTNTLV
ncbi:unnamed protein product, partial [marine sediment metagenome]